ncbi:DUF4756 family protein [Citrobacter koseri]|uniref:DUF4756 family protein n=1 Tax=Citrobacter koseri TaxID=545 RepID=UPI003891D62A
MRKVKTDNNDLVEYFNTIEELKEHIPFETFKKEYYRLRDSDIPYTIANRYYAEHKELRRLEKKKKTLLSAFITEITPSGKDKDTESVQRRMLAKAIINEKSDEEIVQMVIKQRTEIALDFQRSIENSLNQLASFPSDTEKQNAHQPHRMKI